MDKFWQRPQLKFQNKSSAFLNIEMHKINSNFTTNSLNF